MFILLSHNDVTVQLIWSWSLLIHVFRCEIQTAWYKHTFQGFNDWRSGSGVSALGASFSLSFSNPCLYVTVNIGEFWIFNDQYKRENWFLDLPSTDAYAVFVTVTCSLHFSGYGIDLMEREDSCAALSFVLLGPLCLVGMCMRKPFWWLFFL